MRIIKAALVATLLAAVAAVAGPGTAFASETSAGRPVVATFDVTGEQFKVKFTEPADIQLAYDILAGKPMDPMPFPIGTIVWDETDVNTGYTWHLNPVTWTEMATEVCDGRPQSDVETRSITSPYYCPWGAVLIDLQ
ncbi:BP74-related protein [Jidongwangia harbinensis]|uniref:BP74-related protein n=1 Tax=Jidongwangia harbinensis TaxID=2878561 RepID=UPI001CD9C6E9|nr:hypothetical protein [Jidongwangia harbinensis]MCA2217386.1 hypothetical protein [Jidongwangia harbinensis]